MDQNEKYLLHCAGFYNLLAWNEQQESIGHKNLIKNQIFYITELGSSYFSLGITTYKKIQHPFLAVQFSAQKWMKNIIWSHIAIRENEPYLYLVSSIVEGDYVNYSDIPNFAVAISFDMLDKLNLIKNFKKMEARELYIDEEKNIHVNFNGKIFSLPIKLLKAQEPILTEHDIVQYRDLLQNKGFNLENTFLYEPDFQGELDTPLEKNTLFNKLFGKNKS